MRFSSPSSDLTYTLSSNTSAPTIAAQTQSPSRYLDLLQRTAAIALKTSAVQLQRASSFLAGALGAEWQHLLPTVQSSLIAQTEASAYALRQAARDVCVLRTAWIYHLLALAGISFPPLLRLIAVLL